MNDLKIDEIHIAEIVKASESIIDSIGEDLKTLENTSNDIFDRYMAYSRLISINAIMKIEYKITKILLQNGYTLKDEVFHTESYKKHGWNDAFTHEHPFFLNEKREGKIND